MKTLFLNAVPTADRHGGAMTRAAAAGMIDVADSTALSETSVALRFERKAAAA